MPISERPALPRSAPTAGSGEPERPEHRKRSMPWRSMNRR